MACGDEQWWRTAALETIKSWHGTAEHLLIQYDFLLQVARLPQAEFSIPKASKTTPGNTGFVDLVALTTKHIWEIKPKGLEAQAATEAADYVVKANASCGPGWTPGLGYETSRGNGVVWTTVAAPGCKFARLLARETSRGVIAYSWEIDGDERRVTQFEAYALRQIIAEQYFDFIKDGTPKEPGRWQPISGLRPAYAPVLTQDRNGQAVIAAMPKMIASTFAAGIMEGNIVAAYLDAGLYNIMDRAVGAAQMAQTLSNFSIDLRTTQSLFLNASNALAQTGPGQAVANYVDKSGWKIATVLVVATVVVLLLVLAPPVGAAAAAAAADSLAASLTASVSQSALVNGVALAGGTAIMFVNVTASANEPIKPTGAQATAPVFRITTATQLGQTRIGDATADGVLIATFAA